MARVRHYRDLIRGGGTLAPKSIGGRRITHGRHRIIALAAEGAATVAAVRVDRAMRRRPTLATAWIWSTRTSSRVLIDFGGRNSSVALLRPGAAVGLRVLGFGARMIDVLDRKAEFVFLSLRLHLRALPEDGAQRVLPWRSPVAFSRGVLP